MLYEEFLAGVKHEPISRAENTKIFGQYETLETIYRDCEDVTKGDIYEIWRQTYGKQIKVDRERMLKEITDMSEYSDNKGIVDDTGITHFSPEQIKIRRRLLQTVVSITETEDFRAGYTGEITNPDGVAYTLKEYARINDRGDGGHPQYQLIIRYLGKEYGTAAIYSFGDARIHATPENLPKVA